MLVPEGKLSLVSMLYAFGFIRLFTMGGMTGLFLAALGIDVHVTDTYFVIAHVGVASETE